MFPRADSLEFCLLYMKYVVFSTNTYFHIVYMDKLFMYSMYHKDVYVYFMKNEYLSS